MHLHFDLDAFYAAVERLDDPSLAGKPVIVGGRPGGRGVVASCSYEARRFGVHSAMPTSKAYRLCPQAVFVPPRMGRYAEVSSRIMALLRRYSPHVQQVSVDEAFMDASGSRRLFGRSWQLGAQIRARVRSETGLRVSVGGGVSRYVAKLASTQCKPDGLLVVEPGLETRFLRRLSLADLWGVGSKTVARIRQLGVEDITGLQQLSHQQLVHMFGQGTGTFLHRACSGLDPGIHRLHPRTRSCSAERTFGTDIMDRESLLRELLALCHRVMDRLSLGRLLSATVVIKLRYANFQTLTSRHTFDHLIVSGLELYRAAVALFDEKRDPSRAIRLLGVGLAGVQSSPVLQLSLFEGASSRARRVEETVAKLRRRPRSPVITKASLLRTSPPPLTERK